MVVWGWVQGYEGRYKSMREYEGRYGGGYKGMRVGTRV